MKNIMTRAWEIARNGKSNFGGNVKEYFVEALKIAWAEYKENKDKVELVTSEGSRNHKSWVAEITGTHPQWKLNREFVNNVPTEYREKKFVLGNGVYEVCDAGDREFVKIINGEIEYIEYEEVLELVA